MIMKKFFAVMLMAVAFAMPSNAQVKFGVQAGVNVSNVSAENEIVDMAVDAIKSRTGFFIGPTVKFTLPIVGLGVDASALYDQREGKSGDQTLKAQSIQIPINLRYGFGLGSIAELFAFAGPQFGFNIGSNKTIKEASQEIGSWTLKSSNLSANLGIGATVMGHLQAKINYNFALGKTGEMEANIDGAKKVFGSAKMSTWQLSLAYFF